MTHNSIKERGDQATFFKLMCFGWPYFIATLGLIFQIGYHPISLLCIIVPPILVFAYYGFSRDKEKDLADLHDSFIKPNKKERTSQRQQHSTRR